MFDLLAQLFVDGKEEDHEFRKVDLPVVVFVDELEHFEAVRNFFVVRFVNAQNFLELFQADLALLGQRICWPVHNYLNNFQLKHQRSHDNNHLATVLLKNWRTIRPCIKRTANVTSFSSRDWLLFCRDRWHSKCDPCPREGPPQISCSRFDPLHDS